jgi:hypothetical protein
VSSNSFRIIKSGKLGWEVREMNKGFWWWRPERNCPFLSARPDERIK